MRFDLSVYKTTLVGGTRFVGFDNYPKAFIDPKFWDGVVTLVKFGAMQIPVMLILALFFALILDSGVVYAKSFFRISFFIPYAVPTVIATLLWGYPLRSGLWPGHPARRRAARLAEARLPQPARTILPSIANIAVWEYMGYNMIIYFAALQAIPTDLEEAALIDGASAFTYATAHQAAADRADDHRHHHLLDHRHAAALRRALPDDQPGARTSSTATSRRTSTPTRSPSPASKYNYSAAISFVLGGVMAVVVLCLHAGRQPADDTAVSIVGKIACSRRRFRRNRMAADGGARRSISSTPSCRSST